MKPVEPTPLFFGAEGTRLFGWLHVAPPGSRSRFGLVICNPFGFEEVCAHRSLAVLAASAAAAGIPTLRFDYAGCGNSQGDEFDPDRLDAWTASVHRAVEQLKSTTGLAQVCLVGVRLGACLAALAASDRDDIAGIAAIAPVTQGRAYLRELRMLDAASAAQPPKASAGGGLESAGFALTARTVESLEAVDLVALSVRPAARVLIVDRDDVPASARWRDSLVRGGTQVDSQAWPGYAAVMTNPQDACIPTAIINGVLRTLASWQTDAEPMSSRCGPRAAAADPAATKRDRGREHFIERAVRIEAGESHLFGILTSPSLRAPGAQPTSPRRGIVMLNPGSVHHIGPNRLWVVLARRWAAQGIDVLRIDLSGIGDSDARPGSPANTVYSASAQADIAAALRHLRAEGAEECHLMGLCSGAFHALKAAASGLQISSALMVNPLTYSWRDAARLNSGLNEYEILELSKKYRRQVFSAQTWRRLAGGQLDLKTIGGVVARRSRDRAQGVAIRVGRAIGIGAPQGVAVELNAAAAHGVRLKFVFAENAPGHALLRRDAGPALDLLLARSQASVDVVADADHTFTRLEARQRLVAVLDERFVCAKTPSAAASIEGEDHAPRSASKHRLLVPSRH